ncbi:MAG: LLM class flavin-dependent oxidoreductase [Alphaproteobacteria bacterium]
MPANPADAPRYSMFSVCDHYPKMPRSGNTLLEELLQEIALAEELGYYGYLVAEHHFHEYGLVSNPAPFLAAAAQRTSTIRLGPGISVLPFRNPWQVAEDYALVDQLSDGRLIMGVGSGYLKHEYEGFAVDPEDKRKLFDGGLDILRRAWAGETVSYESDWFTCHNATLQLLPVQQPHPPIHIAVIRQEAAYYVGKQNNGVIMVPYATVDRLEEIGGLVGDYARGREDGGHDAASGPDAMVALHTYVADTDDEARAHAADPFDLYVATRLYAKSQVYDDILKSRLALFGSVERVAGQIAELHDMGAKHLLFLMNFGNMPADRVHRSMRLMMEEVIPRIEARAGRAA